jgi:hypothetical protein
MDDDRLALVAKLAIAGAAAWAGYQFLYVPWRVGELTRQQAAANVARGMNLTDAANAAVAAGCVAGSAVFGAPPMVSAGICKGLAPLAVAGAKEAVKGAVVAGKLLGKETAKGAKVVASTAKKVVSSISHGFGLWGLGDLPYDDFEDPHGRPRVERTTQSARARTGRTKQAAAADFYLRHL